MSKEELLMYELMQIKLTAKEDKLDRIKKGLEYFNFILNDCEDIKDCSDCRFYTSEWELIGCTYKQEVNIREMLNKFLDIIKE